MNALICTVSFQLVARVLSVWGGVHQTSHLFVSSEGFWLYIGLRITGIQDLSHRSIYVLEHSLLENGSFGGSLVNVGIFGGRLENRYKMHICVNPQFQLLLHTVAANRQAFIISLDGTSYVLLIFRVLYYQPSCHNCIHIAIICKLWQTNLVSVGKIDVGSLRCVPRFFGYKTALQLTGVLISP